MRERWRNLVLPFAVDDRVVERVFAELMARYGGNGTFDSSALLSGPTLSTGRFYHNLHHIQAVLNHIQPFLRQARKPVALQLAAWFHDVVYDAARHDNEAQSARYAREVLAKLGLPEAVICEVERLILLTARHETTTSTSSVNAVSDIDGQILIDADLAILAADAEQYDIYAQAIRQEYAHVADEAYRAGRAQVLRRLGERPFLYYLPEHQSWEATARANLARELSALTI